MLGWPILKHPAPRLRDIVLQEEEMDTARIDFVDSRLARQDGLHQGLPVEIALAAQLHLSLQVLIELLARLTADGDYRELCVARVIDRHPPGKELAEVDARIVAWPLGVNDVGHAEI